MRRAAPRRSTQSAWGAPARCTIGSCRSTSSTVTTTTSLHTVFLAGAGLRCLGWLRFDSGGVVLRRDGVRLRSVHHPRVQLGRDPGGRDADRAAPGARPRGQRSNHTQQHSQTTLSPIVSAPVPVALGWRWLTWLHDGRTIGSCTRSSACTRRSPRRWRSATSPTRRRWHASSRSITWSRTSSEPTDTT